MGARNRRGTRDTREAGRRLFLSRCLSRQLRARLRLRAVSLFFLVRRAKRARHANDHARGWRRETGEAQKESLSFFFSGCRPRFSRLSCGFAARRSRPRAFPSLNLKKKRDCLQPMLAGRTRKASVCFRLLWLLIFMVHKSIDNEKLF